jgi:hypothetical protein
MRIAAYVMAGDPAWSAQSIASYYDIVDRIVVSYDIDGVSWTGHPIEVDATIARILQIDTADKIELLPGCWHGSDHPIAEVETEQRQEALDHASKDVDWVLQLDFDEIALAPFRLAAFADEADRAGAEALNFPLRHVFQRALDGRLVERVGRWGAPRASYPGPAAVRGGTQLTSCRQVSQAEHFWVDLAPAATDPTRGADGLVHGVISPDEAVLHLSGVRTEEQMSSKALAWRPSQEQDWARMLKRWRWTARHPRLAEWRGRLRSDASWWLRAVDNPVGNGAGDYFQG